MRFHPFQALLSLFFYCDKNSESSGELKGQRSRRLTSVQNLANTSGECGAVPVSGLELMLTLERGQAGSFRCLVNDFRFLCTESGDLPSLALVGDAHFPWNDKVGGIPRLPAPPAHAPWIHQ